MNKLIVVLLLAWFVSVGSGVVFAAETLPAKTPVVKTRHHKKMAHKKMKRSKDMKKAVKAVSTPSAK